MARAGSVCEQFQVHHEQANQRPFDARGWVVSVSIAEAQNKIRDEKETMFLDKVVLCMQNSGIPEDVVVVNLPGISVPKLRHRQITFRFVNEEAQAIGFVPMANRLFDKDESEILELVRSGESRIAEKPFWVLNRWDALSSQQQGPVNTDFENRMQEYAIPPGYQSFRTNALHRLLAQLRQRNESPQDQALQAHLRDCEGNLRARYESKDEVALHESQIPRLHLPRRGDIQDSFRSHGGGCQEKNPGEKHARKK